MEMIILFIVVLVLVFLFLLVGIGFAMHHLKPESTKYERAVVALLVLALILFIRGLVSHKTPHFQDIDPFIEPCYSPLSYEYILPLLIVHLFSILSIVLVYFRNIRLSPLVLSFCIVFMCIGIGIDSQFLYQISLHDTSRIHLHQVYSVELLFGLYPLLLVLISLGLLIKVIKKKAYLNSDITYSNKWLDKLNSKLKSSSQLPLISILMSVPVFLLIVIILTLFGQDIESLNSVYTDTATWRLSQEIHPPTVDDRHGHYLCTVAAIGSPRIVKPIRLGKRGGKTIIVNRQLQIANAFEFMIEEISPRMHKIIRRNYDVYGLNLSRRINSIGLSNFTYVIMKPLEWVFLIALYAFYQFPEKIIARQYA